MKKDGLRHGDWVFVCDSRKAFLAFNAGDERAPHLQVPQKWEHADPPTHEQGTDKPGRAFSGADSRRAAVETTDFHRQEEERFLTRVAAALEGDLSERGIKRLIVVAPPRVAGILRKSLPPSVRRLVHCEIEKDYVRVPIPDLEARLVKHLGQD